MTALSSDPRGVHQDDVPATFDDKILQMVQIYALGSNGSGQLGMGLKDDLSVPRPVIIDLSPDVKVQSIRAGGNHTLILTSDGKLYSSGDSTTGARGLTPPGGFKDSEFAPVIFSDSEKSPLHVTLCAATWEASIIVAKDTNGRSNRLFTFGTGNKGELGQGQLLFRLSKAELVKNFPPPDTEIVVLAAGMSHVVTVLDNGDVYGWGNGRRGQIGIPAEIVHEPRKMVHDFSHPSAVCGKDFTLLTVEATGDYQLLGNDKHDITSGIPPKLSSWDAVGAGWGSVTVLLKEGKLKSGGRNDHGQLAPLSLPKVLQIAVGSEHTLALTEYIDDKRRVQQKVLAWGWGEHGNCGPGAKTASGDVREPNLIASTEHVPEGAKIKIAYIGCGAATSFICIEPVE